MHKKVKVGTFFGGGLLKIAWAAQKSCFQGVLEWTDNQTDRWHCRVTWRVAPCSGKVQLKKSCSIVCRTFLFFSFPNLSFTPIILDSMSLPMENTTKIFYTDEFCFGFEMYFQNLIVKFEHWSGSLLFSKQKTFLKLPVAFLDFTLCMAFTSWMVSKAQEAGVKFNPEYAIKKKQIKYFGWVVSPQGAEPCPKKVKAITDLQPQNDKQELQSFLESINFVSMFIPNLTQKMYLMRGLLKSDVHFNLTSDMQKEFDISKRQ